MELWQLAVVVAAIVIVVAVLVVVAAMLLRRRRRTEQLTARFGPMYQDTLHQMGDRRRAEDELEARERRVAGYDLRALSESEQARFATEWRSIQAQFVDDPSGALVRADTLVEELMRARGYPAGAPFDERLADLSVEHGPAVPEYRAARDTIERHAQQGTSTEQLRRAMVRYRTLIDDLIGSKERTPVEA